MVSSRLKNPKRHLCLHPDCNSTFSTSGEASPQTVNNTSIATNEKEGLIILQKEKVGFNPYVSPVSSYSPIEVDIFDQPLSSNSSTNWSTPILHYEMDEIIPTTAFAGLSSIQLPLPNSEYQSTLLSSSNAFHWQCDPVYNRPYIQDWTFTI
ncbi:hypothetical protein HDV04_005544 [Boothiomyces sp. JEL0838]|nr:hypothetical protein HDV04_005544 [Boothiomyces sp. JEL0838]